MAERVRVVARDNLTARVYHQLRSALMEGRYWPGHRLKIRELAAAMGVSETPVREAVMQLVREKGLVMEAARLHHRGRLDLDAIRRIARHTVAPGGHGRQGGGGEDSET